MESAGEYCDWIPAFAGMTEQVQQDAAGVRGVPQSKLRRMKYERVQRNAAGSLRVSLNISLFFLPPRLGDKGVE